MIDVSTVYRNGLGLFFGEPGGMVPVEVANDSVLSLVDRLTSFVDDGWKKCEDVAGAGYVVALSMPMQFFIHVGNQTS